jgi:hypothetical protein
MARFGLILKTTKSAAAACVCASAKTTKTTR